MMFLATERPRNPLLKTSLSGNEFRPDAAVVDQQYSQPAAAAVAAAATARVKEWAMTEWDLGPDAPCCVTAPTPGTYMRRAVHVYRGAYCLHTLPSLPALGPP